MRRYQDAGTQGLRDATNGRMPAHSLGLRSMARAARRGGVPPAHRADSTNLSRGAPRAPGPALRRLLDALPRPGRHRRLTSLVQRHVRALPPGEAATDVLWPATLPAGTCWASSARPTAPRPSPRPSAWPDPLTPIFH